MKAAIYIYIILAIVVVFVSVLLASQQEKLSKKIEGTEYKEDQGLIQNALNWVV